MGILKEGINVIILQGNDFGKKGIIKEVLKNKVVVDVSGKEKKIAIEHLFPVM